jgi:hypothetical protein
MLAFNSELFSWIACRFRGRADLEVEVIALRHQLAVLRAQRPGRARLSTVDRLIWVWLYRLSCAITLTASPDNVRKTGVNEGIESLAASLRVHGLLQNLHVRHAETNVCEKAI